MNEPTDDALDAQLRAAFAPPPANVFTELAHNVAVSPRAAPKWPWLLAAAALLVTIAFAMSRPRRGPEGHDGAQLGAMWVAAYQQASKTGATGMACCDPGQDFSAACKQHFDVRIAAGDANEMHLRGCYCGSTGGCVAAIAETPKGLVGLFALPRANDPEPQLPPGCGLCLARRELGPLVLYAVSRTRDAAPLEQFELAQ